MAEEKDNGANDPGKVFNYNTGETVLVGEIVQSARG